MANLSNINGKFVVEQTTGYVGVGTTDPNFLIEAAGVNSEIALNSTSGSIYRVRSTSSDEFIITKNGVGDRLVIDGAGNSIFAGNITLDDGAGASPKLILKNSSNETWEIFHGAQGILNFYEGSNLRLSFAQGGNATFAGNQVTVDPASGDAILQLQSSTQTLRIDQNSIRTGTNNNLALFTNGNSNQLVLKQSNGFVGIGTSSPGSDLTIKENGVIGFQYTTGAGSFHTITGGGVNPMSFTVNPFSALDPVFSFNSAAGNIMTMKNGGNVGIGTASPSADLHVNSENTAGTVIIGRTGTNIAASTSVGTITFPADYNSSAANYAQIRAYSNALSSLRGSLDFNVKSTSGSLLTGLTVYGTSSGVNVGIGTDSPSEKLHIYGGGNGPEIRLQGTWGSHYIRAYNDNWNFLVGGTIQAISIKNNGSVGIGVISPSKKLEVAGSFKLGTNAYIEYGGFYPYTITTANTAGVGNLVFSAGLGSAAYESRIDLQGSNTTGAAGITLSTASSTRMVVTADGKIGLGKTDPFYPVDATSFGANTHEWGSGLALFGQDRYSIRELNNLFYSADSRVGGIGTSANLSSSMFDGNFDTGHTIAANTTYIVEMDGSGIWNMTYPSGYATISFYYIYTNFTSIVGEQYHYGGTYAGQWRAMGTAVDIRGSAGSTRVVRINSAGNNYVSKWRFTFVTGSAAITVTDIAFYGTRTAGAPVNTYMRGDRTNEWTRTIRFRNNANGIVGSINPGNTSTTFNTTSDYRLKEDLRDFKGLDMISKIPVYDFRWINSEKRSYGVLAHELNEVYPEAVEGKKDAEENQCVDYSKIVPLLVKSIQELKADNDSLKARIETLENN